jgi:hypothetical protein
VHASRNRIVIQAEREKSTRQGANPREWLASLWRGRLAPRLVLAMMVVTVLVFSTQGVARAAEGSLPSEPLYAVKTLIEDAQIAVSQTDVGDARLYIQFAARRVEEMQQLILEGRFDAIQIATQRFEQQMKPAVQLLRRVAEVDVAQAGELLRSYAETMERQSVSLQVLSAAAPKDVSDTIQSTLLATQTDMAFVMALVEETSVKPSPVAIPTPTLAEAVATHTKQPATASPVAARSTATRRSSSTSALPTTPAATDTPAPTATPEFTKTPKLTDAPKPTKEDKPTDAPKPTKEEKPTMEPKPTKEEKPTMEPKPTKEEKPTKEPKPTKEEKPTKEP